jgi:hypothetical protein
MSFPYSQRIHIDAGMFPTALSDWTLILTEKMVPELTADGWILDTYGVGQTDLSDLRVYLDRELTIEIAVDVVSYGGGSTSNVRYIGLAIKIPLTDPVAGNDIWIASGDPLLEKPLPGSTHGQYNAYDEHHVFVSHNGSGSDGNGTERTRNQFTTTNIGGLIPGGEVKEGILPLLTNAATIYYGTGAGRYLYFDDFSSFTSYLEVDQAHTFEILAKNDSTDESAVLNLASKISSVNFKAWDFKYDSGFLIVEHHYEDSFNTIGSAAELEMQTDTWYSIAEKYDGNNNTDSFDIIVNGVSQSVFPTGFGGVLTNAHNDPFIIGSNGSFLEEDWDGLLSFARLSSISRSDEWLQANYNNIMLGDTLITGYSYAPALSAVIPYFGNEAVYEAFDSVDGGYYDNHADSPFELQAPVAIYDPASPNTVIKMRVYLDSTSTASEYFWGSGSTDTGQMRYNQSNFIYFRDDSNNLQAFDLRPYKDDSWHDLEFTLISQQATATIDGQPVSKGTANPFTDIITMSVLLGFRVASPAGGLDLNQLNKMEIWKDGNLIHAYHFEHTNAAGDLGPDFVLDRIGGNHGYNPRPVPGNWKRGAPSILNGFNLYTNGNGSPIPAALDAAGNELNIDVFGEPIEYFFGASYYDAIASPSIARGFLNNPTGVFESNAPTVYAEIKKLKSGLNFVATINSQIDLEEI